MATSSRPAWVAKISSLNFIPFSLIAGKHLALTLSKIMNLPVTGNFRPILTSFCFISALYKVSHFFLKSSFIFFLRFDSFKKECEALYEAEIRQKLVRIGRKLP